MLEGESTIRPVIVGGKIRKPSARSNQETVESRAPPEVGSVNAEAFPAACCGVSPMKLGRRQGCRTCRRPASPAAAGLCKPRVESPGFASRSSAGETTAFDVSAVDESHEFRRRLPVPASATAACTGTNTRHEKAVKLQEGDAVGGFIKQGIW